MRAFTMIARIGNKKDKPEDMSYVLISSDYQTVTVTGKELINAIAKKEIICTNMEINKKGLVSTNGALDRYTFIDAETNTTGKQTFAVILNRVEKNGKLVGYTAFMPNGTIEEIDVAKAAGLAKLKLISNGKIRDTENGPIVSSINGTYPLREIKMAEAPKGTTTVNIFYFCKGFKDDGSEIDYFGAIINGDSATEMSKLIGELQDKNNDLMRDYLALGITEPDVLSLRVQRMGINSIFGALSLDTLDELIASGVKVKPAYSDLRISALEFKDNKLTDETVIKLDKTWKVKGTESGSTKSNQVAKEFAKEIITKYSK